MLPCAASYRIGTGSLRPGAESDSESESAGAVPALGWALTVRFSSDPASLRNVELASSSRTELKLSSTGFRLQELEPRWNWTRKFVTVTVTVTVTHDWPGTED